MCYLVGRKKLNVLYNDTLNIFYLWLYGIRHMLKDHSAREETCCHHYICYSFRLVEKVLLYALSYRHDRTYNGPCCTSRGSLAWMRTSSMEPYLVICFLKFIILQIQGTCYSWLVEDSEYLIQLQVHKRNLLVHAFYVRVFYTVCCWGILPVGLEVIMHTLLYLHRTVNELY